MKNTTIIHTPGPWRYAESRHEFYVSAGVGDDPIDTIAGDIYGEANARLIAAAPELLEALKRLTFAAECRDNTSGDPIRLIQVKSELIAASDQAREAIEKATQ